MSASFARFGVLHKDRPILGSFVAEAMRRGAAALDIYGGDRYQPAMDSVNGAFHGGL
jgi:hypothetical protein